jgi:type IV pilus assembly protein PilE
MQILMNERTIDMSTFTQLSGSGASRRQRGFTLMELMITITIIGLLAAIAYPNYTQYVQRANRAEARSILLETAQFMERNYTIANRYDQDGAGNATTLPYLTSPKTGTKKYDITVTYGQTPAFTFTLNAIPAGVMVGDTCGTYQLSSGGNQGNVGGSGTQDYCWGK